MSIRKIAGATALAMVAAFNTGATEPFAVEPGQTLNQASDTWYAKNKGDYSAAPGSEKMGVVIEYKGDPTAARGGPAGALPDASAVMGVVIQDKPAEFKPGDASAIDEALLGGLFSGQPTATQGVIHASNAKMESMAMRELSDLAGDGQRPADYAPTGVELGDLKLTIPTTDLAPTAARSLQSAPSTQAIQGQQVAPAAKARQ